MNPPCPAVLRGRRLMSALMAATAIYCGGGFRAVAQPVISEFMASNNSGLADEDGDHSDWIEVRNAGTAGIDLAGYRLADGNYESGDPSTWWTFPARALAPGAHLVVFASGKNRAPAPPGELHTDFSLDASGEALRLVAPDGTVVSGFLPSFPPQRPDISFGSGQITSESALVVEGAPARVHVPTGPVAAEWTGSGPFDDSGWAPAQTGLGFDADTAVANWSLLDDFDDLAPGPLGTQNGWQSSGSVVEIASDPAEPENRVLRMTGANLVASKPMTLAQGSTATLYFRFRRDGIVNASGGASDITIPGTNFADYECQLNNQNDAILRVRNGGAFDQAGANSFADGAWYEAWMVIDNSSDTYRVYARGGAFATQSPVSGPGGPVFSFRNGVAANALISALFRTGSPSVGNFLIDDVYLAPGSELSDPRLAIDFTPHISSSGDLTAMRNLNASALVRIPFFAPAIDSLAALPLKVRYDDGFVAWINGTEVARRRAPAGLAWNSAATAPRADIDAIVPEVIDIASSLPSLVAGPNVLSIQLLNATPGDADALLVPELSVIQAVATGAQVYFTAPTPGGPNGDGVAGFVEDTVFSPRRGFFDAPITLLITSSTPGAAVIYTLDGSAPSPTHGAVVSPPAPDQPPTASIPIASTATVRAIAIKDELLQTNVDTHSYLFVSSVRQQGNTPAGYPTTWKGNGGSGSLPADYEMDPEVINDPAYSDLIDDALLALPTLSIVTDRAHLFDPNTGIYQNPERHGFDWERPASVEFIHPDGSTGFQVDAGLRIQGGSSREPNKSPKHSFRIYMRRQYGDGALDYRLFPESDAVGQFEVLALRAENNNSWTHHNTFNGDNRRRAQYTRDQFVKDAQRAMGHVSTHATYAHLFINGLYWGLYSPCERPEENFAADYFGGLPDDYDVVQGESATTQFAISGTLTAYNALYALVNAAPGPADPTVYAQIEEQVDLVNFADYMILHHWGGNLDWDHHNWFAIRSRSGGRWRWISWDSEFVMINPGDNVLGRNNDRNPSRLWLRLLLNADFRLLFADRIHKHLFNDGTLTNAEAQELWDARHAQVWMPVVTESARWGDYRRDVHWFANDTTPRDLYTRAAHYVAERTRLLDTWFPARTATLINQYRSVGRYPATFAPEFNQHGGLVTAGFVLSLAGPPGATLYLTLDGSDPRHPATGEPVGSPYSGPVVINQSLTAMARARSTAGEWSALTEARFLVGNLPDAESITVSRIHYNPTGPDLSEFIELLNISDEPVELGGTRFTAGIEYEFPLATIVAPGGRVVVARDPAAFQAAFPGAPAALGPFLGETALDNSRESIAFTTPGSNDPIRAFRYDDDPPWPTDADDSGSALVLTAPFANPDPALPEHWHAAPAGGGFDGSYPPVPFAAWLTTHGIATPDDDSDHDGLPAIVEFALGSRPDEPSPAAVPTAGTMLEPEAGASPLAVPTLTFTRAAWAGDVIIDVETTSDLESWSADAVLASQSFDSQTGLITQIWRAAAALNPWPRLFWRVRAAVP